LRPIKKNFSNKNGRLIGLFETNVCDVGDFLDVRSDAGFVQI